VLSILATPLFGRGFGGGGRGGFGGGFRGGFGGGFGGGFRSGDFGGGFRGGNIGGGFQARDLGGGFRGDFGGGDFRGGDFGGVRGQGASNFRGNEMGGFRDAMTNYRGAAPSRADLNRFLDLPSDAGLQSVSSSHSYGDFTVNRGAVEGPRGGAAGGTAVTGPGGTTVARGGAVGPQGGAAVGRAAVGPAGAGVARGAVRGPAGGVAGGTVARGPEGGIAARGAAVGPGGAAVGFRRVSPSERYLHASAVRRDFNAWELYTPGWYAAHPGAWAIAGLTTAAWRYATWGALGTWFGAAWAPMYYDYGNTIVYQDGDVYMDGEDVGTTQQYYQQAASIAATAVVPAADQQWLPLGVFAMTRDDQSQSNLIIQLAVNKQGILRGNYTDTANDKTLPIQGAVDRQTQRVAWTIGDNTTNVLETGLYNLTKDEAPLLVHFGKDRTEQWLLVRLEQPSQPADGGQ
jgi:hypothetical protein